ncbi:uncharacterized protein [Dermacentor andersoni]|uniref:uncharacterized protein n=1 Tax=Dermacentor andersoni TaxID=34620 RepID=UPI003B3A1C5D
MFALVRFVEDKTDKRYVIPVTDVKNFHPENELDFHNTVPYDAYWRDEDNENSGVYVVQILKLSGKYLLECPADKKGAIHRIVISFFIQDRAKQANQAASRKQQYEAVLRQHMAHALKNVDVAKEAKEVAAPLPTPRSSTKQSRGSQRSEKCEAAVASSAVILVDAVYSNKHLFFFTYFQFHSSGGIFVVPEQAEKLCRNKKPSILVRDTAQVIWGNELLAKRCVSGRLAPTKSGSSEQPSKQLTPAKVEVVYDCLRHWGQIHNQDMGAAERSPSRTLSEKIQGVKRKLPFPHRESAVKY